MARSFKSVTRFRPRGSTLGWHRERVKCDQCHGAGLLVIYRATPVTRICNGCNARGYTIDWIKHSHLDEVS